MATECAPFSFAPFATGSERVIQASPAALMHRVQAEVWRRRDRPSAEQRVDEFEEGITPPREGIVHRRTEGGDVIERSGFHAAHYGTL
jgi:hypothetical protein